MIHYIKISNFGPIKDEVELNFEAVASEEKEVYEMEMPDGKRLLKLAYIYGANASGKTTLLKAFEFIRTLWLDPALKKDETLQYDPFLFCPNPDEVPSVIELSFYPGEVRYVYKVVFTRQAIISEEMNFYKTKQPALLFSRNTDLEKRVAYIQFGSKVKVAQKEKDNLESSTLHNNTVLGAFEKTNVDIAELEQLNVWAKKFFQPLVTSQTDLTRKTVSKLKNDVLLNQWMNQFLNKADKNIQGVTIQKSDVAGLKDVFTPGQYEKLSEDTLERFADRILGIGVSFWHGLKGDSNYSLPIKSESNGTQRYFGLGGELHSLLTGSHLLCIDELETSLHADLMKHFLQTFLLNSDKSQMLFTTHNLFLLEEQDLIRRDALWFTDKNNNGEVTLYAAADFDSSVLRKGASLANAYKSGRLGAKPNLGSPYMSTE